MSFTTSFNDPDGDTGKDTQFYSMLGTRAIWHKGWKAAAAVTPAAPNAWLLSPAAPGALRHRQGPKRVSRPRRPRTRPTTRTDRAVARRSRQVPSTAVGVPLPGAAYSRPSGRSSPSPVTGTSTIPAAAKYPSPSPPMSGTAPTRLLRNWRSTTPKRPGFCFPGRSLRWARPLPEDGILKYVYNFAGLEEQMIVAELNHSPPVTSSCPCPSGKKARACLPKAPSRCTSVTKPSAPPKSFPMLQVLAGRRGTRRWTRRRRARNRRLSRHHAMDVHRRNHKTSRHRRERRTLRRPGPRSRRHVCPRIASHRSGASS